MDDPSPDPVAPLPQTESPLASKSLINALVVMLLLCVQGGAFNVASLDDFGVLWLQLVIIIAYVLEASIVFRGFRLGRRALSDPNYKHTLAWLGTILNALLLAVIGLNILAALAGLLA